MRDPHTAATAPEKPPPAEPDYLRGETGIASWLLTRDHKRIGIMFFIAITLSLIAGGVFALLMRFELIDPAADVMTAQTYNRMFTLHGVIMVFMFMIPSIPTVFGNFMIPLMLGAQDVAFPRINLLSFYVYVVGSTLTLYAIFSGGLDSGWTFYVPYSTTTPRTVAPAVLGVFILGISSILTGLNFIVTTHTMRTRGLRWHDMQLFVWNIYATSVIQVLATPVLGMSLLLVALDSTFALGIFDPEIGGDPVLFQHLFWFYSHPAVYIMILPAQGTITELVCSFSKNSPISYRALAYSAIGIAFVGFLTWGHHMFVSGMSEFDAGVFGVLSMFVAIFSAIKVFTWVATLRGGVISFTTPMLYFFWFLFLFVFGGMTGVAVATSSLDVPWHDTYFVVAHFHFIMVGGTLTAFLGAVHYWFPKMFGRTYSERWGLFASGLVFIGFVLTFTPQFLLGNMGMPRRYYSYPDRFQLLNVLSSGGAAILGLGLVLTLTYLLVALARGPRVPGNPWGSRGFEWLAPSPPPKHNFEHEFVMKRGPYDYRQPDVPS